MFRFTIRDVLWLTVLVALGCDVINPTPPRHGSDAADSDSISEKQRDTMQTKTLAGHVSISNLPPHQGLMVSLAFFRVNGPGADAPYNGDPPTEAVTDCPELYNSVDLDNECVETTRSIPFAIKHEPGHYYIQLRAILYRKQDGKVFAQVEQFFFGRRPLALVDDLPSVTLPVNWPSIPLEELWHHGTIKPQKNNDNVEPQGRP